MNEIDFLQSDEVAYQVKKSFLKWQCRVRQICMRESGGRPDQSISPTVKLNSSSRGVGQLITIINKNPEYSVTSELIHIRKKNLDPASRREQAVRFLSSSYYQKYSEFSATLTGTFLPNSSLMKVLFAVGKCILIFEAYNQKYQLNCTVSKLAKTDYLHKATIAHNELFNSYLHPKTEVLAFEPIWKLSFASKSIS